MLAECLWNEIHGVANMMRGTAGSQAWSCLMRRDQNKNVINDISSWYQINGFFISNLNLTLILADLIFKQIEAIWLAELIISAIYDQLMKLNFLS